MLEEESFSTVISTLSTPNTTNSFRRHGNTTRQIDFAIQELFKGHKVKCLDHYLEGGSPDANERLLKLVLKRLHSEHHVGIVDSVRVNKLENLIWLT